MWRIEQYNTYIHNTYLDYLFRYTGVLCILHFQGKLDFNSLNMVLVRKKM